MLNATQRDVANYLTTPATGVSGGTLTAAGAGDNSAIAGADVNREDFLSGLFLVVCRATLTATKKLSVVGTLQDAPDNGSGAAGTYADVAAALQPSGVAGGAIGSIVSAGGGTVTTVFRHPVNLSSLRKFVRLNVTPDLDAGATDTAQVLVCFVGGGSVVSPNSLLT